MARQGTGKSDGVGNVEEKIVLGLMVRSYEKDGQTRQFAELHCCDVDPDVDEDTLGYSPESLPVAGDAIERLKHIIGICPGVYRLRIRKQRVSGERTFRITVTDATFVKAGGFPNVAPAAPVKAAS
jgi:hypothetical protein